MAAAAGHAHLAAGACRLQLPGLRTSVFGRDQRLPPPSPPLLPHPLPHHPPGLLQARTRPSCPWPPRLPPPAKDELRSARALTRARAGGCGGGAGGSTPWIASILCSCSSCSRALASCLRREVGYTPPSSREVTAKDRVPPMTCNYRHAKRPSSAMVVREWARTNATPPLGGVAFTPPCHSVMARHFE